MSQLGKNTGYSPFSEWTWRTFEGKQAADINQFIAEHMDHMFFVGTDSQNYSKTKTCIFTSVLVAYKWGKGGCSIIHKDKVSFVESLRQRLLTEAMRSLEVAWYLDKKIPKKSFVGIHLDVNQNLKYKSAHYKEELVGLVLAQGYQCWTKPNSWCASTVADSKC